MTKFKTDIQIAQEAKLKPIAAIAKGLAIKNEHIEFYGRFKAKIRPEAVQGKEAKAKLILVTAMNPTPAGEGKTTITVGLADALSLLGKKTIAALREPSLGPVFGIKGGAAGGGYAQVVPMEDINLHFTGDIHAVSAANNLLAAIIDNHIYYGNALRIDNRRLQWRRCMDMNDRQLRNIVNGLGACTDGVPRQDGFDITAASEVMAALCMAKDLTDLKERLGNIVVGFTYDDEPVTAKQLNAHGAMAALLREAMMPNLVQTLEGTPVFIHGGPFANIAHGCNSVAATLTAMKLADYVVTEAGFGADLGAEKFLDIKCRNTGIAPSAVVIVATARALKYHGGVDKTQVSSPNCEAVLKGLTNLGKHIENITQVYNLPVAVAINRFVTDTEEELQIIKDYCAEKGVKALVCNAWGEGGKGNLSLAEEVVNLCNSSKADLKFCYDLNATIEEKLETLVKRIYGGKAVEYTPGALKSIANLQKHGYDKLPICVAKTQYSLSDNPLRLGRPSGFDISVRDVRISAGAGFIVVLTGEIMTMPGLPRVPSAEKIDVDEKGRISGLF